MTLGTRFGNGGSRLETSQLVTEPAPPPGGLSSPAAARPALAHTEGLAFRLAGRGSRPSPAPRPPAPPTLGFRRARGPAHVAGLRPAAPPPAAARARRRCQRGPSLFPRRRLEVRAPAGGGAGPAAHHVAAAPGAHPAPVGQQRALLRRRAAPRPPGRPRGRGRGRGRGGWRPSPPRHTQASRR